MKQSTLVGTITALAIVGAIYLLMRSMKKKIPVIIETPSATLSDADKSRIALAKQLVDKYVKNPKQDLFATYKTAFTKFDLDELGGEINPKGLEFTSGQAMGFKNNVYQFTINSKGFIKAYYIEDGNKKVNFFSPYPFDVR